MPRDLHNILEFLRLLIRPHAMREAGPKDINSMNPPDYVELDRRFRELDENVQPEQAALDSYTRLLLGRDTGLAWMDLLKSRLVVLLGEPGSGKTYEFRHKCEQLRRDGLYAFFVRLDTIAGQGLENALGPDRWREFQEWQGTQDTAAFFLDSVDEAKFHRTSDFYCGLDKFRDTLGPECLKRARILLSSRIGTWQPHGDKSEVICRFPQPTHDGDAMPGQGNEPILVVQIAPLDKDRVCRYVRARGIADGTAFVDALDHQHLWEFARRPVDVVDMLDYWQGHGQFGSLTEMVEHSVTSKLRPSQRDQDDPLSEQEARNGAEILGAATVLCRQFNFKVPDDAFPCADAIDTNQCLPESWPMNKRQALLTRPIFDSASYGRIRFHTRRVAEHLAAAWLRQRMDDGCPVSELEVLLFDHVAGPRVMRQAMSSVIAWLCCGDQRWNEDLRNWVLESNPLTHLQYGDPSALPLDYRRKILNALVQMSEGRDWLRIDSSPESLGRLAAEDLSDDMCRIIRSANVTVSVRIELIQMVRYGQLHNCLSTLLDLIESTDEPGVLKRYAAAAIRDMGDKASKDRFGKIVGSWDEISHGLCGTVCEALYPDVLDGQGLIGLVQKASVVPPRDNYLSFSLRSHLESTMRQEDAEGILIGILGLQEMPGFSWSLETVPTVLHILLQKRNLSSSEVDAAAGALRVIAHHVLQGALHDDKLNLLDQATAQHPSVRQRHLWLSVGEWRQQKTNDPVFWMAFPAYYEILHPSIEDLAWLLEDVSHRKDPKDRVLALRLAMETWDQSGRKWKDRQKIRRSVGNDASLLPLFRQLARRGRWPRVRSIWHRRIRGRLGQRRWWKHRLQRAKKRWIWLHEECTLLRNLQVLRSGRRCDWLNGLLHEASGSTRHDKWGVQSWVTLRTKRGRWIASATREGSKRFWNTFVPQLPHEKRGASTIENGVIVGHAGIQAALEDGDLDFATVTTLDAERAARYAVNDVAGFSLWLPDLAKHQPHSVRKILDAAILGEWEASADWKSGFGVVENLASHGESLVPLVQDRILELLTTDDPRNHSILNAALLLLLRSQNPVANTVAAIARKRVPTLSIDSETFALWTAVWLQLDAAPALDLLQEILPTTEVGDQVMVEICGLLAGERLSPVPILPNPSYMIPRHCQRLIVLVYHHVKQSEDVDRSGGGACRDWAQMFRDGLLERLSGSEDDGTTEALKALLTTAETAHRADWILHFLNLRLQKKADHSPWTAQEVRSFVRNHEIAPKTDTDLFQIVCKRLADIKHDVEKSENSLREEIRSDDEEPVLRRWLARKLCERSRDRYTVPQEEEIDQAKRPDLRIENPHTCPVSIEIKWAENWTIPELLEGLERQLVGQYLRSDGCRYGVYLLAIIGRKEHWEEPETKTRLLFEKVLDVIEMRASELVANSDHIQAIEVVPIDFRPPRSELS